MAVGAYAMAILVTDDAGMSFWLALPIAIAGHDGLRPARRRCRRVRLRADYLAIATIAAAEAVRLFALNARRAHRRHPGALRLRRLLGRGLRDDRGLARGPRLVEPRRPRPALPRRLGRRADPHVRAEPVQKTPWGRVLRAVREDEDAARALGKNAFAYKLQSLVIARRSARSPGSSSRSTCASSSPTSSCRSSPSSATRCWSSAASRTTGAWRSGRSSSGCSSRACASSTLPIVTRSQSRGALASSSSGSILILLMAFRPQGMFGKKEEMVLGD